MSTINRHAAGTSLQEATTPMTSKGATTRAPNILPAPGGRAGQTASIHGDKAQSPGTRKI